MTTARDVIAKCLAVNVVSGSKEQPVDEPRPGDGPPRWCNWSGVAREVEAALLTAPEPVRQELATLLNPCRPTLERIKNRIDYRLNDYLCEMKPNYDDSIAGFNEAWGIVSAIFKE